ncbi:Hypothetical protein, putative [Bodo saltans]|uniref:Uncharacterized protein n=1 Tax=Bodo saltans TaxID=75058 RepID=A0A0S4JH01_BODSA|nr:Hypothetical protein, putative [Bodo saltans]|eukprot:CUG90739.1 Hypothetical protein, putative [Bodo saltans]
MAMVHRFNWMGSGRSESAMAVVSNFRDGKDFTESTLRNRDYDQRRQTARFIRDRLNRIKQELGLVPEPERDPSPDPEVFDTPQKLRSARDLAASVRTMLLNQGDVYVSYIDGSAHRDLKALLRFNSEARAVLEESAMDFLLAPADEFSTENLERMLAKEVVIRKQLDSYRSQENPEYATTLVLPEGGHLKELIEAEENEDEEEETESPGKDALELSYSAARATTRQTRADYNTRATAASKTVLADANASTVCAKVHESFR